MLRLVEVTVLRIEGPKARGTPSGGERGTASSRNPILTELQGNGLGRSGGWMQLAGQLGGGERKNDAAAWTTPWLAVAWNFGRSSGAQKLFCYWKNTHTHTHTHTMES